DRRRQLDISFLLSDRQGFGLAGRPFPISVARMSMSFTSAYALPHVMTSSWLTSAMTGAVSKLPSRFQSTQGPKVPGNGPNNRPGAVMNDAGAYVMNEIAAWVARGKVARS